MSLTDLFVNSGKSALVNYLHGRDWYIAVGTKKTKVADPATLTALEDELERKLVGTKSVSEYTLKLEEDFTENEGCGTWRELGLFDSPARAVMLHNCDSTTNWTSDNTLSLEPTERKEGTGALEAEGSGNISFRNQSLSPDYAGYSFTSDDKFRIWYYVQDTGKLTGDVIIEISSSTTDDADEWEFAIPAADLTSGWNWISKAISSGTQVGSPNLNAIVRFKLHSGKGTALMERIDKIRLFGENGVLWCRSELEAAQAKEIDAVQKCRWDLEVCEKSDPKE